LGSELDAVLGMEVFRFAAWAVRPLRPGFWHDDRQTDRIAAWPRRLLFDAVRHPLDRVPAIENPREADRPAYAGAFRE
jgi:hypothetical protein